PACWRRIAGVPEPVVIAVELVAVRRFAAVVVRIEDAVSVGVAEDLEDHADQAVAVEIAAVDAGPDAVGREDRRGRIRASILIALVRLEIPGPVADLVRHPWIAPRPLALPGGHAGRERPPALQVVGEH